MTAPSPDLTQRLDYEKNSHGVGVGLGECEEKDVKASSVDNKLEDVGADRPGIEVLVRDADPELTRLDRVARAVTAWITQRGLEGHGCVNIPSYSYCWYSY